ncbi:DUF397 domain-containing protein [Streptomyces sp. NPDC049687]|uniref:DUF397 domain-containing protein n=1 Tax=Streptomyces sp. NPDC049687 TaxID=3365596 RepID=UPI0037A448E7
MTQWQKSTYSGGAEGNECVELARADNELLLRESDDPTRMIRLPPVALTALLQRLRAPRP